MRRRIVGSIFGALILGTLASGCSGSRVFSRSPRALRSNSASTAEEPGSASGASTDASDKPARSEESSGADGSELQRFHFLTLEEEALAASSFQGLRSVWIFWPALADEQPNHAKVDAFRLRLDQLLASRGDMAILEFHQQHRSAETAPRRDRSRHEHLWDPQGVTGMRLALSGFPVAVIVSPKLELFDKVYASSSELYDFYLSIVNALARLDAEK